MTEVRAHVRHGRPVRQHVRGHRAYSNDSHGLATPTRSTWVLPQFLDLPSYFDEFEHPPAESIDLVWIPTHWAETKPEANQQLYDKKCGDMKDDYQRGVYEHIRGRFRAGLPVDPVSVWLEADGSVGASQGWHRMTLAALENISRIPVAVVQSDGKGGYLKPPLDVMGLPWWRDHKH